MKTLTTSFYNNGNSTYNDVVYDHPPFEVQTKKYSFLLQPKTKFWRFGIALSKTAEFEFEPQNGRYNNQELKFIQINVGDKLKDQWQFPNRLEFATYYIEGVPLHRFDEYTELSDITLQLSHLTDQQVFVISYATASNQFYETRISLPGYQYFKIFAWADRIEFKLDCTITINNNTSSINLEKSDTRAYWLLKIRPQTWEIRGFKAGQETWFSTHNLESQKRAEYGLLQSVKPGDIVIGFAYENYNSVVCTMQVTESVHSDPGKGEVISMKIIQIFNTYIPLKNFQAHVSIGSQLEEENPTRWYSITEQEFKIIVQQADRSNKIDYWLPSYTAEGNHLETSDQLDFIYDIKSFASVISLKEVKPPLAIGLFGNWGSGKSFFMENLKDEIHKLKGSHERYVEQVVQVTFNSWHYSDANLWASLITEIFDKLYEFSKNEGKQDELEKLSQTLQITTMQKEVTEAKKRELEEKQTKLEIDQAQKRADLKDLSGLKLVQLILQDAQIQEDLKLLENKHIESIFKEKDKVEKYLVEVKKDKNKLIYFLNTLFSLKGHWKYVIGIAFVLFIVTWMVNHIPFWSEVWKQLTKGVAGITLLISAFVTKAIQSYQPMKRNFQMAYDRLKSLLNTIESRPITTSPELSKTQSELKSIMTSLESLEQEIRATKTELEEIKSGKKLLEFIEQRSRDEQYSRQLGLISWIRKDFNKLDELLRKQYQLSEKEKEVINPKNIQLKIDRIILYIDDLDRCNEEIVVRVLEAVHLLLAFELFVVVVGVDPRWLNQSLNKKYTFFKDPKSTKQQDLQNHVVSSFDYLEKIFQIPFSLKPITKDGREDLLAYLVRNEMQKNAKEPTKQGQGSEITEVKSEENSDNKQNKSFETIGDKAQQVNTSESQIEQKKLIFSTEELVSMKDVSALFGHTPRTIKRFVNIYRIIKSHQKFKESSNPLPTLLLLAIVVGCPDHAQVFVRELLKNDDKSMSDFLNQTDELKKLKEWISKNLFENDWIQINISEVKNNLDLVSRFSFRTYPI